MMAFDKHKTFMMISQLSKRSDIPISTIKFYLRENLLPKGIKANRTTVYYGQAHLDRLETIKNIRKEGLCLRHIKKIIEKSDKTDIGFENQIPSARRENIIDATIPLFLDKGLERTSITDIVKASHISRNTFYREFKSKRDAFVACLDKIFRDMINKFNNDVDKKMAIHHERDPWRFLDTQSSWTDFMNLLGATIVNDPQLLDKMLDDHIELRANSLSKGFDIYLKQGLIRPVDTKLLGLIVLGIIDYCSRFLRSGKFSETRVTFDKAIDIIINGIGLKQVKIESE